MQGESSAHALTVSELNGKKIARPIEGIGHDAQSIGIIDMSTARRNHLGLPIFWAGAAGAGIFARM
jgi:hypothetical protein